MRSVSFGFTALAFATFASSATAAPAAPCGVSGVSQVGLPALSARLAQAEPRALLSDPSTVVFSDRLNPAGAQGEFTRLPDAGCAAHFRASNPRATSGYYGVSARLLTSGAIRKGDVLLARFAARALNARQESGEAEGLFSLQPVQGGEPEVTQSFSIGPDWTVINVPFVARRDYAAGEAGASLNYATLPQSFEIAGLQIYGFGAGVALADLPTTAFTYAGREADAAWRREALKRIEELRTAPLKVRVVDASGRPVRGAAVKAEMIRSEFLWGTAVSAERLVATGAEADRYRSVLLENFDMAVIENGLKWPRWRDPEYRARALQALDWLDSKGMPVKGHTLVWPAWKFSPKDIAQDPAQQARIGELVEAHIRDITQATRGRLIGWDVINEAGHENDYFKHVPRERVAEWFKMAERSDPKLQLTLNDYGMLNRSSSPVMIEKHLAFAQMLKANGARVDILGVQGHVGQTPRPPVSVLSDLDLLARDGHQIQVTEFDINTRDEQLQADYTRDFLIALYSHPKTTGMIKWGFWEAAHWKPAAAMYRPDWTEKPNLKPWQELVRGQWRTRVSAPTGADGRLNSRGHLGRYRITASHNGRTVTQEYDLRRTSEEVVVTLR